MTQQKRLVDHIIVHCSATPEGEDFGAADIDKWHRARGWLGNGYHFVLRLDGTIESKERGHRCRPLEKPGAHVGDCGPGWNRRSIGICLIGGVDADMKAKNTYSQEQLESLYWLINDIGIQPLVEVSPEVEVMGHRDLIDKTGASPKACPSFDVQKWLDERDSEELEFEGLAPFNSNFKQ
ncbi:N-acetylmuramoyl-L-alanine amidase [Litchfieldella qijiaojingensis]|uniref:N-acetylmuramoyl-L-alanine amidase n=1 Tax=Litchfieldella qijiaojingensis TaxID=980347 RepID=A0ABQ2YRL2_9GAMM|nr:N-acetylmuramoyl-L-alanine amidase [Halomonas qijiaojingensis]GGX90992.1 N-acetylmuramoyl-L-alanine amidase [Halomonas qijiaojingensis]